LIHYRLVEQIGEGGMGVVWKAVDTKLDREVAVKILPDVFADNPDRLARFDREAKLLASLNHRNIAAIYGLEESNGLRFLVMELVEGQDLARRLNAGALPVEEALDVGHQLARALEAAHEQGVLHRDLKPANVQVTEAGRVKVLDFGLAKAFETESASKDPSLSPTLTSAGTAAGMILGTAAYMSPEQARGKTLDKRTDIWAFGCVLYEALTGKSAFRGETVSDTVASILKTDPDWTALPERTPPRVRELLQRCLEKDAKNRLRDIGDARLELQRTLVGRESLTDASGVSLAVPHGEVRRRQSVAGLALAAVVGAAVGIGLWTALTGSGSSGRVGSPMPARVSIQLPPGSFVQDGAYLISPDGSSIAFAARPRETADPEQTVGKLYLRRLDSYETRVVEGTANGVQSWSFSPDSNWLAFRAPVAPKSSKTRISKVPVDGSAPPLALSDWDDRWEDPILWLPDGDILIITQPPQSLVRIPTDGSVPPETVALDFGGREGFFTEHPSLGSVLPDGQHLLGTFTVWEERGYEMNLAVVSLATGEGRELIENANNPQLSPTGHLVFSRGDTLLAVRFDSDRLETIGSPVSIAAGLRASAIWTDAYFNLAGNGTLLHKPGGLVGGNRRLCLLDDRWNILEPLSEDLRAFEGGLAVSPDGRRFAVGMVNDEGLYDIWVGDTERPRLSQLVREAGLDCTPALWTPDSERLVYGCGSAQGWTGFVRRGDGTDDTPELLISWEPGEAYIPTSWLPGGSSMVATHLSGGEVRLVLLPLPPTEKGVSPTTWIPGAGGGKVSPDGRWVAYQSDASGRSEVYLRELRSDASLGPEIAISGDGGGSPGWRPMAKDGTLELRYGNQFDLFAVTLTTEGGLELSRPRLVTNLSAIWPRLRGGDQLPDGRLLVILRGEDEEEPVHLSATINWFYELESRMGDLR
jgi:serine/threonine protein kinase